MFLSFDIYLVLYYCSESAWIFTNFTFGFYFVVIFFPNSITNLSIFQASISFCLLCHFTVYCGSRGRIQISYFEGYILILPLYFISDCYIIFGRYIFCFTCFSLSSSVLNFLSYLYRPSLRCWRVFQVIM